MLFSWFEERLDPFPAADPAEPPATLVAFCWYYTRACWPFVLLAAACMAAIAIMEVWMFGFLGHIVDWLAAQNRETFLQTEKWKLIGMALVADGLHFHIPREYLYFAVAFSGSVEILNQLVARKKKKKKESR